MTENERIEFKVYLDRRTMKYLQDGAERHSTSVSGFLRLFPDLYKIPRLLTREESELIDELRKKSPLKVPE